MTKSNQAGDNSFIDHLRQKGMNKLADMMKELLCRTRNEPSGIGDLVYHEDSKKWVNHLNNFVVFKIQPQNWEILVVIKNVLNAKFPCDKVAIKKAASRLKLKIDRAEAYASFKLYQRQQMEDAFRLIISSSLKLGRAARAAGKN